MIECARHPGIIPNSNTYFPEEIRRVPIDLYHRACGSLLVNSLQVALSINSAASGSEHFSVTGSRMKQLSDY